MAVWDPILQNSEVIFWHIIKVVLILIVTSILVKVMRVAMQHYFKRTSKKLHVDATKFKMVTNILTAGIYILGLVVAASTIPQLKMASISLLAGAGVFAMIIGFASQKAFSNIISGIFITIFRPYSVGDLIKVGDYTGKVEDLTLRHTILKTWDNIRIVIPNSSMDDKDIVNHSIIDDDFYKTIEFGIAYDADIDKARKIIIQEALKHPDVLDKRDEEDKKAGKEKVRVRVTNLGDFAVTLRLYFWADNMGKAFGIGCDILESVKKRFDREGVEIPFPYRTMVYKKDLLAAAKKRSKRRV